MVPPIAFRSILFPVDFSEANEVIASHVRGLAEQTGATVRLLHVVPELAVCSSVPGLHPEEQQMVALEIFREKYFSEIPSELYIRSGAIAETITDTATEFAIDLIMMPTSGLGCTRRFLVGSTTSKVLHDAPCAVWTGSHGTDLKPFSRYQHILCTIDRDDVPLGYLEDVVRLAACFHSQLSFITVVPSLERGLRHERDITSLAREFPQVHIRENSSPVHYTVLTETGSVGDFVRQTAEGQGVDLVLTSRSHLQHPLGRLPTHIYEIVLASPCAVLNLASR
jgi:nucleotide-binding universal stress UspA family protein